MQVADISVLGDSIYLYYWWCSLFLFANRNFLLRKLGLKNQNQKVEICYQDYFEYEEFNGDVHVFNFWPKIIFLKKHNSNFHNFPFQLKFVTENNSNMQNSMVLFIFLCLDWKFSLWVNLIQKMKIVTFWWNLVPRLNLVAELNGRMHFFRF